MPTSLSQHAYAELVSLSTWPHIKNKIKQNNAFYLSVNVFSMKVLIGDPIFYVSYWRQDHHFTWSFGPREDPAACTAKGVLSFLSYFKTLSNGLARGIEPAISRSAVECSTD